MNARFTSLSKRLLMTLLFSGLLLGVIALLVTPAAAQVACSQSITAGNTTELNEAITCFNSSTTAGTTTISLTADIVLTGATTTISNATAGASLLIEGNGQVLDANSTFTGLVVGQQTVVTINKLTVQRGVPTTVSPLQCGSAATACGGGVLNYGQVTISSSTFLSNTLAANTEAGGGIANVGGALFVNDSTFRANSGGQGSAVANLGFMAVSGSTFESNTAAAGAVVNAGQGTIDGSTFTRNIGGLGGGALNVGTLTVRTSSFTGNQAIVGAALNNNRQDPLPPGQMTVIDSIFTGNQATNGGAMSAIPETVTTIMTSTFTSNVSAEVGGGLLIQGDLTLSDSTFTNNAATDAGGAVRLGSTGTTTIERSTFDGNQSARGGALNVLGNLTLNTSTFTNNSAGEFGGALRVVTGVLVTDTTVIATNNTFSGNSAGVSGGGISTNKDLTLNNNTLTGNAATTSAGGLHVITGTLTMSNTIIANSLSGGDCQVDASAGSVNASHTLIEATGADACNLVDGTDNNQIGVDPNLAALADNGGATQTHALQDPSPAVNAGDDATCATLDQRGYGRPDNMCDIGAYEADGTPLAVTFRNATTASQASHTTLVAIVVGLFVLTVWAAVRPQRGE